MCTATEYRRNLDDNIEPFIIISLLCKLGKLRKHIYHLKQVHRIRYESSAKEVWKLGPRSSEADHYFSPS